MLGRAQSRGQAANEAFFLLRVLQPHHVAGGVEYLVKQCVLQWIRGLALRLAKLLQVAVGEV